MGADADRPSVGTSQKHDQHGTAPPGGMGRGAGGGSFLTCRGGEGSARDLFGLMGTFPMEADPLARESQEE